MHTGGRQLDLAGAPPQRRIRDRWAPGVRQAQQLCHLVEGLADRVVAGLAQERGGAFGLPRFAWAYGLLG